MVSFSFAHGLTWEPTYHGAIHVIYLASCFQGVKNLKKPFQRQTFGRTKQVRSLLGGTHDYYAGYPGMGAGKEAEATDARPKGSLGSGGAGSNKTPKGDMESCLPPEPQFFIIISKRPCSHLPKGHHRKARKELPMKQTAHR